MESRPEVVEVVRHLGEAAGNWNGLMPPCVQAKAVVDLMKPGEFEVLILPWCNSSTNGTNLIAVAEGPIRPQPTYRLLWADIVTAINKAKAVQASSGSMISSGSDETLDGINYSEFEILILS